MATELPTWIFHYDDEHHASLDQQKLIDALRALGAPVLFAQKGSTINALVEGPCVCRAMEFDVFETSMSQLMAHWGRWALNADCSFVPLAHFLRCWRSLSAPYANAQGEFFLKPDKPYKLFCGALVKDGPQEIEFLREYLALEGKRKEAQLNADSMIMISSPKTMVNEYRFIVAGGRIASGSPYRINGQVTYLATGIPPCVMRLAEKCAADRRWQPAPVYTLDIADDGSGRPKIVELNNFPRAILYNCDMRQVALGVSRVAVALYNTRKENPFAGSITWRGAMCLLRRAGLVRKTRRKDQEDGI